MKKKELYKRRRRKNQKKYFIWRENFNVHISKWADPLNFPSKKCSKSCGLWHGI